MTFMYLKVEPVYHISQEMEDQSFLRHGISFNPFKEFHFHCEANSISCMQTIPIMSFTASSHKMY